MSKSVADHSARPGSKEAGTPVTEAVREIVRERRARLDEDRETAEDWDAVMPHLLNSLPRPRP